MNEDVREYYKREWGIDYIQEGEDDVYVWGYYHTTSDRNKCINFKFRKKDVKDIDGIK